MSTTRFDRLQELTKAAGLDLIALVPGPNMRYLTGADFHLSERPLILFVPVEGEPTIVIPFLEASKWYETSIQGQLVPWRDDEGYHGACTQATQQFKNKRIGVEGLRMRVLEGQLLEELTGQPVIDAEDILVNLRIRKDADELDRHRRAIQISEQALQQTLDALKLGMTEREIATMLSRHQRALGGGADSFSPTVLIGPRSALPHGGSGDTPLEQGTTLLIDFGTTYEGYVSDITRTFFVGEPSDKHRAVYEAVLAANTAARAAMRPGMEAGDLDVLTTNVLREHGFGDYILHRTGHGLGIDVHEHPNINKGNTRVLEEGMVFTIEPGLYIADELGVRIEDNVVVTADGGESMTSFPRELRVLEVSE